MTNTRKIIFLRNHSSGYFEVVHKKSERVCFKGFERREGLYEAIFTPDAKQLALASVAEGNQTLWHKRLGHASHDVIGKTASLVKGMSGMEKQSKSQSNCEDCVLSKSCRNVRPSATIESAEATKPLDLVHTDIIGPMKYSSFGGKRYIIPLYDDCSAASLVRFLKTKDEAGAAIKEMITELETMRQGRVKKVNITVYEHETVKRLRSDNAKEFLSKIFKKWLSHRGIQHKWCSAYSPESNGKAERLNRTLLDMARTMLIGAQHLPN